MTKPLLEFVSKENTPEGIAVAIGTAPVLGEVEPSRMASDTSNSLRMPTDEPVSCIPHPGRDELTVLVHESKDRDTREVIPTYLRSRGIVHRALRLFESWEYQSARIICSAIPVDILAIRDDAVLLVQVISTRATVLDAATLTKNYGEKIQHLREMGTLARFRKILLAYSPNCGWKYYDVLPGGLIPAWDLAKMP